jgi:anti-sigma B factor antagonist
VDDRVLPLSVRVSDVPSGWVLRVTGELDAATAPDLLAAFDGLPVQGQEVVVDMAAVSFVDSSGLRALVQLRQAAESTGRQLVVRRPARQALRLLQLSGLTELVAPDEAAPA